MQLSTSFTIILTIFSFVKCDISPLDVESKWFNIQNDDLNSIKHIMKTHNINTDIKDNNLDIVSFIKSNNFNDYDYKEKEDVESKYNLLEASNNDNVNDKSSDQIDYLDDVKSSQRFHYFGSNQGSSKTIPFKDGNNRGAAQTLWNIPDEYIMNDPYLMLKALFLEKESKPKNKNENADTFQKRDTIYITRGRLPKRNSESLYEPKAIQKRIFTLWSRHQSYPNSRRDFAHRRHFHQWLDGDFVSAETRTPALGRPPGSPLRWG